jgi:hypothetical protein
MLERTVDGLRVWMKERCPAVQLTQRLPESGLCGYNLRLSSSAGVFHNLQAADTYERSQESCVYLYSSIVVTPSTDQTRMQRGS